jgi:hypothetical protein
MDNAHQEPGIKLRTKFTAFGLKNIFQGPGVLFCRPESTKFLAIIRFHVVVFAVYLNI